MAESGRCWRRFSSHRPRNCRRRSQGPARRSSSKTTRSRSGMSRGSNRSTRFTRTATTWSGSPTRKAIGSSRRETAPGRLVPHQGLGVPDESGRRHARRRRRQRSADAGGADRSQVTSAAPETRAEPTDGLRQVAGAPAWENNRAAAWLMHGRLVGSDASPRRRRRRADIRCATSPESDVRPRWNGSRRPGPGRRRVAHTSSRSSRRGHEADDHRPAHLPDDVRVGGRCRRAAPRRVWTGRRQRETGVGPLGVAHHRCEMRLHPRKPVREDPHEPGHLGLRRSG